MNDTERTLEYMLAHDGKITAMEAMKKLKMVHVAARIRDLRNQGHDITTHLCYNSRSKKRYAVYQLED